MSMDSATKSSD